MSRSVGTMLSWLFTALVSSACAQSVYKSTSSTTNSSGNELTLVHRQLVDFELVNTVLLTTVDGSLQARERDTGKLLWTIKGAPLVDIQESVPSEEGITWLAEPSEQGNLYFFTEEGGIERIAASVRDLVAKAPFCMPDNIVYTGSQQTQLYAIDIRTGEVLHVYGRAETALQRLYTSVDMKNIVMIGRTEYTLDIHEQVGGPGWKVKIASWSPNSRDYDLKAQYSAPRDGVYVMPMTSSEVAAVSDIGMNMFRWIGHVPGLLTGAFDVLQGSNDGALALVPQAYLKTTNPTNDLDLYVDRTSSGSAIVVSGPRYAALLGSAQQASYCHGTGSNISGVHPSWCQLKTNAGGPGSVISLPPSPREEEERSHNEPPREQSDLPLELRKPFWKKTKWRLFGIFLLIEFIGINYFNWSFSIHLSVNDVKFGLIPMSEEPAARISADSDDSGKVRRIEDDPGRKRKRGSRGGRKKDIAKVQTDTALSSSPSPSYEPPIVLTDTVLGYGSHGTTVFKGRFENREVAVKRMLLSFYDVASHEVDILKESDNHPNVVRYFCKYQTEEFLYIALELCPGTLDDLVGGTEGLSLEFDPLESLRQVTLGVQHLHSLQIVHRDIKPQNILVGLPNTRSGSRRAPPASDQPRYLISDFGLCRKLEGEQSSFLPTMADTVAGTAGWAAPEIANHASSTKKSAGSSMSSTTIAQDFSSEESSTTESPDSGTDRSSEITRQRLTRAVDIFSLGCLFYYTLSGGKHPFGDTHMRQYNILRHEPPQIEISGRVTPEAADLIARMVAIDPAERPTTVDILRHPLFWPDQKKLDFLVRVSDRLEHDSRLEQSDLIDRLEDHAPGVVGDDWHARFPEIFNSNLGQYRRYRGNRILDLLRALRNKMHHYNDFSEEMKEVVGPLPAGYLSFFTGRFPKLLMTVYWYAHTEFGSEDTFALFYN